jgi:hypothetical protein
MRLPSVFFLMPVLASAQPFSFGLKAGVPLTSFLSASSPDYRAAAARYTFGPALEVALPFHLAAEGGLLYAHLDYGFRTSGFTASRWEVPLLLKYRFGKGLLRPFAGAGLSFNRITGVADARSPAELRHRGTTGLVLAAGIETRAGRLRIAPELRISRWADRNFGTRDTPLQSSLTQAALLLGAFW